MTDTNGNDLSDPLFGDVTIFFDTYNTENGTIYKLKAMLSISTTPANILITASGGEFKLAVAVSGAESFLNDTGMRFSVSNGECVYTADLTQGNHYSNEFKDSNGSIAKLSPNEYYSVFLNLIDAYDSPIPPGSIHDIKVTFQAIAADGYHQVMFVSQDEVVQSYLAFDNDVIENVPVVSRNGYVFKGWMTPDGKEITEGYVISPNDGDIYAVAQWEYIGSNTMIYIAGAGGGAVAAALLLLLLLKRRKHEPQ